MRIKFETILKESRDVVWNRAVQMDGVNEELFPIMKMTYPNMAKAKSINECPLKTHLFTSIILLFCLIPIDTHFLKIDRISPYAFWENSSSLTMKEWKHHRRIRGIDSNDCQITDEVDFHSRLGFILDYLLFGLLYLVFWNRHRNLKQKYNHK